jgi:hypothetical protein
MWLAACFDDTHAVKLDRGQELMTQSGFPNPWLPRDHYRLWNTGLCIGKRSSNLAELGFTADVLG